MQTKHVTHVGWISMGIGAVIIMLVLLYGFVLSNKPGNGSDMMSSNNDRMENNSALQNYDSNISGPGTSDEALGLPASSSAKTAADVYVKSSDATSPDGSDFNDSYGDLSQ